MIFFPAGPTRQPLHRLLSLFCSARRTARVAPSPASILAPRAGHPRVPCHPFTLPLALSLSAPDRPPFSPQTLAPNPHCCRRPELLAAADSPPSGSPWPIPRTGSSLSPSSSDSGAHPALGLAVQVRRRSPRSAAAQRRRAARPLPFLACATTGEACRHLLHPVCASPAPLRLRFAALPCAAAARRHARATSWPHPRRGQGPACLDPAWVGRLAMGPTCRPLAWRVWLPSGAPSNITRVSLGFICPAMFKNA